MVRVRIASACIGKITVNQIRGEKKLLRLPVGCRKMATLFHGQPLGCAAMITFSCECGKRYQVKDELAGKMREVLVWQNAGRSAAAAGQAN